MTGPDARRARRWFWALTGIAILAMGALYRELGASPGPGTGLLTLLAALVLLATGVQAARILARLAGPPRLPGTSRHGPDRDLRPRTGQPPALTPRPYGYDAGEEPLSDAQGQQ